MSESLEQMPVEPRRQMVGMSRQPVLIRERKEFIPSWCDWHPDLNPDLTTPVWTGDPAAPEPLVVNGVHVLVGYVLPERRFAIDPRGRIYDKTELEERMEIKFTESFAIRGQKMSADPKVIPKPNGKEFVAWTVDSSDPRKRAKIGFDPHLPADPLAKPIEQRDPVRDPVAKPAPGLQAKPDGIFVKPAQPEKTPTQRRIDEIDALHARGAMTDDERTRALRSVVEGAGWATPSSGGAATTAGPGEGSENQAPPGHPAPSASPPAEMAMARCGKQVKKRGVHLHQLRCKACAAVEAGSTSEAS